MRSGVEDPRGTECSAAEGNLDFHALAQGLAARLPRATFVPTDAEGAARWKEDYAERLREVVRYPARTGFAVAEPIADEASRAEVAGDWTWNGWCCAARNGACRRR